MIVIAKPQPRCKTGIRKVERSPPAQAAERQLGESGYLSLMHVVCTCHAGVARLTGKVPSFHMKQVAQEIVGKTSGVVQVLTFSEVLE